MIKIADSHTHLDQLDIKLTSNNIEEELFNKANNVKLFITIGTKLEDDFSWLTSYENIYCTYGIHPCDYLREDNSCEYTNETLDSIEKTLYNKIINNKKCIGIGEIGLDFFYGKENDYSYNLLHMQLALAKKLNLPISVHARGCNINELINIIISYKVKFVLHCFTGDMSNAMKAIENNGYVSFSGILTFGKKAGELEEISKILPINRILIETDAPYLAPTPYRGKTNHPKYLIDTLKHLSNLRKESLEETASYTYKNTCDLFNIK
jgi:TatD DNase family protein